MKEKLLKIKNWVKKFKDSWFGVDATILDVVVKTIFLAFWLWILFHVFAGIILLGLLVVFCTPVFFILLIMGIGKIT